jgi:hypothetical protein
MNNEKEKQTYLDQLKSRVAIDDHWIDRYRYKGYGKSKPRVHKLLRACTMVDIGNGYRFILLSCLMALNGELYVAINRDCIVRIIYHAFISSITYCVSSFSLLCLSNMSSVQNPMWRIFLDSGCHPHGIYSLRLKLESIWIHSTKI